VIAPSVVQEAIDGDLAARVLGVLAVADEGLHMQRCVATRSPYLAPYFGSLHVYLMHSFEALKAYG
jgi:hypothetical protein